MTPSTPSGPQTEAGRWLVEADWQVGHREIDKRELRKRVVAIEAEAGREAVEAYRLNLARKIRARAIPKHWFGNDGQLAIEEERESLLRLIEGEPHADPE